MKRILSISAMLLTCALFAYAQEAVSTAAAAQTADTSAQTAASTTAAAEPAAQAAASTFNPSASVSGALYFTGYFSQDNRGVSMEDGNDNSSLIAFKFQSSEYTGSVVRFNLSTAASDSTPTVLFKDAYIYSNILGEFGIKAFSLTANAGYKNWHSDYYCPSAMSIDDTYMQSDKMHDRLNARLDASYNNVNLPLCLSFATDLDLGSANNDVDNNDAGQTFWAQLGGKQQPVFGYANISWNGYYNRYYNELTTDASAIDYSHYIDTIGGTIGVDVLKLPFALQAGAACEFKNTVTENDAETAWNFQAGLSASMPQLFTAKATYLRSGENPVYDAGSYNPARYIAGQASFDMIKKLSIYGGIAYQFNETVINAAPSSQFQRLSWETGVTLKPVDKVSISTGWQRGAWGINAPVRDLTIETGDPSWGEVFLQVCYVF